MFIKITEYNTLSINYINIHHIIYFYTSRDLKSSFICLSSTDEIHVNELSEEIIKLINKEL